MLSLFVTILKLRHSLIPTIYIVDDEEATSRMFAKYLQTKGYRVVVSPSAIQFLSVFEPEQRGCIVIDERMPELSGLQALESIAKWLPIYPAILLTGYADVSLTVKVMKTGAFDVLEKPIEPDVLLAKIEQALGWALEVWERHSADVQVWSDMQTLTSREREILGMIIEGQSSRSIGNILQISARTVDNHRVHILSKMRAKSLSDLGRAVARATTIFSEPGINVTIPKTSKNK